jgi:hypothetical protein
VTSQASSACPLLPEHLQAIASLEARTKTETRRGAALALQDPLLPPRALPERPGFVTSWSKGRYFHHWIRPRFRDRRIR